MSKQKQFFVFVLMFIYPFVTMCIRDWAGEGSKPTISSPLTVPFIHSMKLCVWDSFLPHTISVKYYINLQIILKIGWAAINLPPAGGTVSGVREGRPAITLHNISVHTIH